MDDGRGRFRAFGLGRVVDWLVTYCKDGTLSQFCISMIIDNLKEARVEGERPAPPNARRGVSVRIAEVAKDFRSLREPSATDELAQIFAIYLRQYPAVKIHCDDQLIDPKSVENYTQEYTLPDRRPF